MGWSRGESEGAWEVLVQLGGVAGVADSAAFSHSHLIMIRLGLFEALGAAESDAKRPD